MKEELNLSKQELINLLFHEDDNIDKIFNSASDLGESKGNYAPEGVFNLEIFKKV